MIDPPIAETGEPHARVAPLPHLTGDTVEPTARTKGARTRVVLSGFALFMVCSAAYGFYRSGTLFRPGFASPFVILLPAGIVSVTQLYRSIRLLKGSAGAGDASMGSKA